MAAWLYLIVSSFIQEIALYTSAFLVALENDFGFISIFLTFVGATALDILIGFRAGKWFQRTFKDYRLEKFLSVKAKDANKLISEQGKGYIFTLLGIVNYPYLNAFLASWLDISFKRVFVYTFIGDLISFTFIWAVLLGISSLALDYYISIVISSAIVILLFFLLKKSLKL